MTTMQQMSTHPPPIRQYLDRDGRLPSHIPPATLAEPRWVTMAPEPAMRLPEPIRIVERELPDGTRVRVSGEELSRYSHVSSLGMQQPHAVEHILADGTRVHKLASPAAQGYHPHQLHHQPHLFPPHQLVGRSAPSAPLPAPNVIRDPADWANVKAAPEIIRVPAAKPAAEPAAKSPPVQRAVHAPAPPAVHPQLAQFHAAAWWNYHVATALAAAAAQVPQVPQVPQAPQVPQEPQVGTGQIGTVNVTTGYVYYDLPPRPPPKNPRVQLEVKSNGETFERLGVTAGGHRYVSYGLPMSGGGRKITSVGTVRAEVHVGKK